jgi:hypothetical protein
MERNKFDKIAKSMFFIVIIFIIIYTVIKYNYDREKRISNPRYTIGTVINLNGGSKAGNSIDFIYKVKNKGYSGRWSIQGYHTKLIGKRFYIKFESGNPDNCEILLDKPVPDSIKTASPEGWEKIP